MDDGPKYNDPDADVSCFVDEGHAIWITLPDVAFLTAEQAQNLASALLECATWVRQRPLDR